MVLAEVVTNPSTNPERSHTVRYGRAITAPAPLGVFLWRHVMKRTAIGPLCECGCGYRVSQSKAPPYTWNRFVFSHRISGIKLSEEHKRKISSSKFGHKVSAETRKKISDTKLQRKSSSSTMTNSKLNRGISVKTQLKMSVAKKGIELSAKHKKNISISRMGHEVLSETRKKISVSKLQPCLVRTYCDSWYDLDYKEDLRLSACENCGLTNMMNFHIHGRRLDLHHKNGKRECSPDDIKTL